MITSSSDFVVAGADGAGGGAGVVWGETVGCAGATVAAGPKGMGSSLITVSSTIVPITVVGVGVGVGTITGT